MIGTGIWQTLGWILLLFAAALALPIVVALASGDYGVARAFLPSLALAGFVGASCVLSLGGGEGLVASRQGAAVVVVSLAVLPPVAALPFLLSGVVPNFVDAYFEAVSGLTTTGATVLRHLSDVPHAVLFWRALLEWLGGFGAIVFAGAFLVPLFFPGLPVHQVPLPPAAGEMVQQRLERMAEIVWPVYVVLTIGSWMALWMSGVDSFEGLCLAMSGIATGGFMPRDGTLAAFGDPWVSPIMAATTLLGALNFFQHVHTGRTRELPHLRDGETQVVVGAAVLGAVLFAASVARGDPYGLAVLMSDGFMLALSSGFSAGSDPLVGLVPTVIVLGTALTGGAMISTAGGFKLIRLMVLLRLGASELARLSHPHRAHAARLAGHTVESRLATSVWSYFFVLLASHGILLLTLTGLGMEFEPALTAAVATLTNTGAPLVYLQGEHAYAGLGRVAKLVLCGAMIAGRVEFLALLAVLNPAYWRR
ncbi:MAG: hypothetical protein H6923_09675 [Alphaproteobacteria bacterium]|nr:hypothetical protein [Alphaproteobacteria bacterium]